MRPRVRAGVAALALLACACEPIPSVDSIVIAEATDVNVLLPVVEVTSLEGELNKLLYPGLNSARWENGAIEYVVDDLSLAERWEFGPDSTTLTYYLRSDAVWSDGKPIDADDVMFTYDVIRRPEIAFPFTDFYEHLDSVTAADAHTVTFYFTRRYPEMLLHSGLSIIPAHVYAEHASDPATLAGHPSLVDPAGNLVVGGPFQVAEWHPGERLVLEANPRAFTGRPHLERVVFRFIPDETTRLIELRNGSVDVINPAPTAQIAALAEEAGFRLEPRGARFYDFIAWNGSRFAAFADPEVRRALSLAIDREGILSGLGVFGVAAPAAGPYPTTFHKLSDPGREPDPYLPDSATTILRSRGWRDSDGDAVLDRDGRPFRFTLVTTDEAGLMRSSAAEIIQAQLEAIGIDVEIELLENSTLIDLVYVNRARDFQAALVGWRVGLNPSFLRAQFWPVDAQYNVTAYANTAIDSLIPQALAAASEDEAARYWRAAAACVAQDRPYAFLWFYGEAVAVNDRVKNTRIDVYSVYQNLHHWRVEP